MDSLWKESSFVYETSTIAVKELLFECLAYYTHTTLYLTICDTNFVYLYLYLYLCICICICICVFDFSWYETTPTVGVLSHTNPPLLELRYQESRKLKQMAEGNLGFHDMCCHIIFVTADRLKCDNEYGFFKIEFTIYQCSLYSPNSWVKRKFAKTALPLSKNHL